MLRAYNTLVTAMMAAPPTAEHGQLHDTTGIVRQLPHATYISHSLPIGTCNNGGLYASSPVS